MEIVWIYQNKNKNKKMKTKHGKKKKVRLSKAYSRSKKKARVEQKSHNKINVRKERKHKKSIITSESVSEPRVDKAEQKKAIKEAIMEELVQIEEMSPKQQIQDKKNQIARLKRSIQNLEITTNDKFSALEDKQLERKYMRNKKENLIQMVSSMSGDIPENLDKLIKEDLVEIILKGKYTQKDKSKRKGRRKTIIEHITREEITKRNSKRNIELIKSGHKFKDLKSVSRGYWFEKLWDVCGLRRFHSKFLQNVILWYSNNGWNKEEYGYEFIHICNKDYKLLKDYLPNWSFKFEEYVRKNYRDRLEKSGLRKILLLTKQTRKGFCQNLGCSQEYSKCDYIIKYTCHYYPKVDIFRYTLYHKGTHDNFLIGESKPHSKNIFIKSYIRDGLKDEECNNKILNKIKSFKKDIPIVKGLGDKIFNIKSNEITNRRYYENKKKCGTYKLCFDKAVEFFEKWKFPNLKMVGYDSKTMKIVFIVRGDEIWSDKKFTHGYLDGTFKTRFWRNAHYNLMAFARLLPGTLITCPIAFTLSFSGETQSYLDSWNLLMKYLKKRGIITTNVVCISDLGKSEIGFARRVDILNHIYCWWHTLQAFKKNIGNISKNEDLFDEIVDMIREIYSSKTIIIRNRKVKQLEDFLKEKSEKDLLDYFSHYFGNDILNRWTCFGKISIYFEHTSNYLEKFFGSITNKKLAKQKKLLKFIKELDNTIETIKGKNENEDVGKKKNKALKEFNEGMELYLIKDFKPVGDRIYKVDGTEIGCVHTVDMKNWWCSCKSFNLNGYPCKHIMFIMVDKMIESGIKYKDLQKATDIFKTLKEGRKLFLNEKEELLKKMVDYQEAPVTIGVEAFYSSFEKSVNL